MIVYLPHLSLPAIWTKWYRVQSQPFKATDQNVCLKTAIKEQNMLLCRSVIIKWDTKWIKCLQRHKQLASWFRKWIYWILLLLVFMGQLRHKKSLWNEGLASTHSEMREMFHWLTQLRFTSFAHQIKILVKALYVCGFLRLREVYPAICEAKLEEGAFVGLQIRKLLKIMLLINLE